MRSQCAGEGMGIVWASCSLAIGAATVGGGGCPLLQRRSAGLESIKLCDCAPTAGLNRLGFVDEWRRLLPVATVMSSCSCSWVETVIAQRTPS